MTPYRCKKCQNVLGECHPTKLVLGGVAVTRRLIKFLCAFCDHPMTWRPARIAGFTQHEETVSHNGGHG